MTTAVQRLSTKKSPVNSPKFTEDAELLTEENLNKVAEALKTPSNLDELMKQLTSATKNRMESTFKSSDLLSPIKRNAQSAVYSPNSTVKFFEPMEHLNSSDEDECTFQPKINPNAGRLTARVSTGDKIHETLHKLDAERETKRKETLDQHVSHINERSSVSKIGPKSVKLIYQRLQQSIRNLVKNNESAENSGQVNFEGLGTILYQLGVFQTLEFTPSGNDGEKSSLSINQTKAKPERITKEIMFHENLYKICNTASSEENLISGDLVFKFLMVLVEEKTPVADAAYILQEILDIALEASGKTREEGKSIFAQIKEEKSLWGLEKVVIEFRKLFEDKTSFMSVYSPSNVINGKKLQQYQNYPHSHTPKTSSKTQKLDKRYFSERLIKHMATVDPEVNPQDLKERTKRLYTYNTYLQNKKGLNLEARIQEELSPCTFTPKTTQYKKKKSQNNKTHDSSSINGRPSSSPSNKKGYFNQALDECGAQRHMLLYEVAQLYREKLQQKAYSLKKKEEIGELSYCTFQPKLNHHYEDSALRGQDFYEGVPNGFKKTVDRLHKGEQLKQMRQAEAEKIPRGENYEKNRAAEFKPPVMLSRAKITKPEVLVYVDVSIGHGKTGRIGIHKGDNARTLAHHFARTHSLNNTMKESLETLLQSYIDNYFAQPTPKKPEDEGIHIDQENRHDEEEDEEDEEEGLEEVGEDEEGEREDQHRESM